MLKKRSRTIKDSHIMKPFWITLLSLLCLTGGLYAQDEPVNDTVYLIVSDYNTMLDKTRELEVDFGPNHPDTLIIKCGNVIRFTSVRRGTSSATRSLYFDRAWQEDDVEMYVVKLYAVPAGNLKSTMRGLKLKGSWTDSVSIEMDLSGCTALESVYSDSNLLTSLNVDGCMALKKLDCSKNRLTSLDVSGCMALEDLSCSNNLLTSLDLSGLPLGTYGLSVSGNPLDSLSVSGCKTLGNLNLDAGQLKWLDVSGCTALKYLYCSNNLLTSLDLSDCTALQQLHCDSNLLTSLDLRNCTSLWTAEWAMNFDGNPLDSLNISGLDWNVLSLKPGILKWLDASGCTNLHTLKCSKNQLTSLNVSGCTALLWLDCQNNLLTSLDVSDCSDLWELKCFNNQLASLDVSGCTNLNTLNCSGNQLTTLDVRGYTDFRTLNCSDNQLTSLNISDCSGLRTLNISNNQLASLDVSNLSLWELNCSGNQLTTLDVKAGSSLDVLDCSYNQLTKLDVSGCQQLYALYCSGNKLTSLNLFYDAHWKRLACDSNCIPLSKLPKSKVNELSMSPQVINKTLRTGDIWNLSSEMKIKDTATEFSCTPSSGFTFYSATGRLKFQKSGDYVVQLSNEAVKDYHNGCAEPVIVYYYITVSGTDIPDPIAPTDPDDPTDPTDPTEPTEPVAPDTVAAPVFSVPSGVVPRGTRVNISCATAGAKIYCVKGYDLIGEATGVISMPINESMTLRAWAEKGNRKSQEVTAIYTIDNTPNETALSASTLRVYAQDRTIYLSEPAGEVEVFTTSGRRVYRGVSTAIPVPRPGVYIVTAAGQKYKVGVK